MRRICYYPELVQRVGSINAALMMAQLEFWFKVTEGRPFYKFLEPCGHELYKTGDSWAEELGMTSSEIRSAFKRIGTIYKSKRAFMESEDVFKGKPYASYYDRIRKTTYYLRNVEKVKQMMPDDSSVGVCGKRANTGEEETTYKQTNHRIVPSNQLIKPVVSESEDIYVTQVSAGGGSSATWRSEDQDGDGSANQQSGNQVGDGSINQQSEDQGGDGSCNQQSENQGRDGFDIERDTDQGRDGSVTQKEQTSVSYKSEDGLYREDYIDNNIQDKQIKQQKESYSLIPYTEIVKLYNDHLGELLGYTIDLAQQEKDSIRILWLKFHMKIEDFKNSFMKVAASRFLCGKVEGKNWRASLRWLITGKNLSKVLAGVYDDFVTYTRSTPKCTGLDKIKQFNQMESHHWDFDEIERLERLYIDRKLGVL